jgi:hypothetical protein
MTISARKRLNGIAAVCALCVAGLLVQGVVYGAGTVPSNWNTSEPKDGAYLESLESTPSPDWIGSLGSLDSVDSHVDVVTPTSRQTTWFPDSGGHAKVLKLNTGSSTMENTLTGGGFSTEPVFVDMRVKFEAQSSAPDLGTTYKCAVYASDATTLKVVHSSGAESYTIADLTAKWHQLTLKFNANDNTKFDVLLDDSAVVSGLTLKNNSDKLLNAVAFNGTGSIDELYVSHGNPKGAVPSGLSTLLTGMDSSVKGWLNDKLNAGTLTFGSAVAGFDSNSKLNKAYLLDTTPGNTYTEPVLGIQSFEITDSTHIRIKFKLQSTDGSLKNGLIKGKVKLHGKTGSGWADVATIDPPTFGSDGISTPATDVTVADSTVYSYFYPEIIAP